MNRLSPLRYRSLLTLLCLCLSWSAWLQAEHIHLHGDGVAEECLVYHQGTSATLSSGELPLASVTGCSALPFEQPCATKAANYFSQPARGPPSKLS